MAVATRTRHLVTGGNPEQEYPVPTEDTFEAEAAEYLPADDLRRIARALIAAHPSRFRHLERLHVVYLWRKAGGARHDTPTLGKCQKPSGLLKHFSAADFVIWLAADHCRDRRFTAYQVEALLFHELCHTDRDPESGKPVLVGHDWEGFAAEVAHYGAWESATAHLAQQFEQLRLALDADGPGLAPMASAPLGADAPAALADEVAAALDQAGVAAARDGASAGPEPSS